MSSSLRRTVLYGLHVNQKARMAPFGGYEMPIQYPAGAIQEHLHTRRAASIFDVSHVGYLEIRGKDREKFFEWVTPSGVSELTEGAAALTMLMNEEAGVKDDCIVSKYSNHLLVILNAGCKAKDIAHLRAQLAEFKGDVSLVELEQAMFAIQGPAAATALAPYLTEINKIKFMHGRREVSIKGIKATITRCGYTGEDGFEIMTSPEDVESLVQLLLENKEVKLAGLAARDSLRIEAGLNLYGHELGEETSAAASRVTWCIPKRRMRDGGFIGHTRLQEILKNPTEFVPQVRVGFRTGAKGPVARAGMPIIVNGEIVGNVSSGVPSPTLRCNIGMGFVTRASSMVGQKVEIDVRGKRVEGEIVPARFVRLRYYKGGE